MWPAVTLLMHKVPLGSLLTLTPGSTVSILHDINWCASGVEGLVLHSRQIYFPALITNDVIFGRTIATLRSLPVYRKKMTCSQQAIAATGILMQCM